MNAKKAKLLRRHVQRVLKVDRIEGHPDGFQARVIKGWIVNRKARNNPKVVDHEGNVTIDFATRVDKYRAHVHPESSRAMYHALKRRA